MNMIKRLTKKKTGKTFTDKNGKEHEGVMYWLELNNGNCIAVKPVFSDGYKLFDLIAEQE